MTSELENIHVSVKKEMLKGAETEVKTEDSDEKEVKLRKLMETAGLKKDTIKEHFKEEGAE